MSWTIEREALAAFQEATEQLKEACKALREAGDRDRARERASNDQMSQLAAQMREVVEMQRELQRENIALRQTGNPAAATATAPTMATPAVRYKGGRFSGRASGASDVSSKYRLWRDKLSMFFVQNPGAYPDDRGKMMFTCTQLDGDAADLMTRLRPQLIAGLELAACQFSSMQAMLAYLNGIYDRGDDMTRTTRELETLSMQTVPDFHQFPNRFESLCARLGVDDITKVMKLRAKLPNHMLRATKTVTPRPPAGDYAAWSRIYADIHQNQCDIEVAQTGTRPEKSARQASAPVFRTPQYSAGLYSGRL